MATLGSAYVWGPDATTTVTAEDVVDLVVNIDPIDAPFVTSAPKTTARSTLHEWVTDTLDATATASGNPTQTTTALAAWPEGADFDERDITTRSRVTNLCQIFRKDIKVSNTMRAINPYGVADEYTYQIMKAVREIGRNMEVSVFRASGSTGTGGPSSAPVSGRLWKSLQDFLTTNAAQSRGTMLSNSASIASATCHPVREQDFNAMLDRIYRQGGNPDVVYVSPAVKRYISEYGRGRTFSNELAGSAEINRDIAANVRRLTRAIDIYDSDFGPVQIVLDRHVPQSTNTTPTALVTGTASSGQGRMFFLESSRNRLAWLRPVRHVPLPPGGDNTRGIVVGEATLEVLAEKGSGMITLVSAIPY